MSLNSPEAGQGLGLEDRLRGLIISNGPPPASASSSVGETSAPVVKLPPHLIGATPEEQQSFLMREAARHSSEPPRTSGLGTTPPGRRRLNQAQRRQMNAQLSIPLESTHVAPTHQAGRGFSMATGSLHQPRNNGPSGASSYGHRQGPSNQQGFQNDRTLPYTPRQHQAQPLPNSRGGFQRNIRQNYYAVLPPQGVVDGQNQTRRNYAQQQYTHPQDQREHRPPPQNRQLFNPGGQAPNFRNSPSVSKEQLVVQEHMLDDLIRGCISLAGVDDASISAMESFRSMVEEACRETIKDYEMSEANHEDFDPSTVELKCFGSMASGFATKSSDMDLALLSPKSNPAPDSGSSQIPRLLEKKLLAMNLGARLLTKTRVPIIKLCQRPTKKLLQDLRENHEKWVAGKGEDDDNETDEIEDALEAGQDAGSSAQFRNGDPAPVHPSESGETETSRKPPSSKEEPLTSFRQKEDETLGDYYARAKKLLHTLGGKDVHSSKVIVLSDKEVRILDNVCMAFLSGLDDTLLKARLFSYHSLNTLSWNHGQIGRKSLSGIYSQIEGERLVMGWEQCPLTLTETAKIAVVRQIENWQRLCNRVDLDPMSHNRYFFQMADQIRKIAILQLAVLRQSPAEDPSLYYFRTQKILQDLQGHCTSSQVHLENVVTKQYVKGINSANIERQLTTLFVEEEPVTLAFIAQKHLELGLAEAYESACAANKFTPSEQVVVRRYIESIRGGTNLSVVDHPDLGEILSALSELPDPLATNKSRPRDRYNDALEFPKDNIGIQCDINFSAQLAIHNTLLLRCYSLSDPRVRPLVLFVKHWAKVRDINTPYRGTLSSYGYVLMVLHYLVNIATPFVCPNLQALQKEPPQWLSPAEKEAQTTCLGKDVRFWRNEKEIDNLAQRGLLNHNKQSTGLLLRGFFEYYAQNGFMSTGNGRGFDWGREVLSLRTIGGVVTKQSKGWVGARTDTVNVGDVKSDQRDLSPIEPARSAPEALSIAVQGTDATTSSSTIPEASNKKKPIREETKEIRHRYLFAIEDPFELDHNVARTVTHLGIVSVRDEFRRAWRLIRDAGHPNRATTTGEPAQPSEGLLDPAVSNEWKPKELKAVFRDLYGEWDVDKQESGTL